MPSLFSAKPFGAKPPKSSIPSLRSQVFDLKPSVLCLGTCEQARGLDLHTGSHSRRNRDPVDEVTLGASRPRLLHRIGKGADILDQLFGAERGLADAGLDDARLLGAEFHRAAFGAAHGVG